MPLIEPEAGLTWSDRASLSGLGAVLDPDDRGAKNELIDRVQRHALESALRDVAGRKVLDFGCGTGRFSALMRERGAHVLGIDAEPRMVAESRRRHGPHFAAFDGERIPVRDGSLDLVLTVGVLVYFHGTALTDLLTKLATTLRPGGRVLALEQVTATEGPRGAPLASYEQAFAATDLRITGTTAIRRGQSKAFSLAQRLPRLPPLPGLPLLLALEARRHLPPRNDDYIDLLFEARRD